MHKEPFVPYACLQKYPRFSTTAPVDVLSLSTAVVESLTCNDISLGGLFVVTRTPCQPGAGLRVRVHADGQAFGAGARVVHVLDDARAAQKHHPPGMGLEFGELGPEARNALERFVQTLSLLRQRATTNAVPPAAPLAALGAPITPRFVAPGVVEIAVADVATLRALWERELRHGGLFAHGTAPPLGARVEVRLSGRGVLRFTAEVVHVLDPTAANAVGTSSGVGLQLIDLDATKRDALLRFLEGKVDHIEPSKAAPPSDTRSLEELLLAARRLFQKTEEGDLFGALGLKPDTPPVRWRARVQELVALLDNPPPEATPPQRHRLEQAKKLVRKIEVNLSAVAATTVMPSRAPEAALARRPPAVDIGPLLEEAERLERSGDRIAARKVLERALDECPRHPVATARMARIQQVLDESRAHELVTQAEVFAENTGMKREARSRILEALEACQLREVRLRALKVLVRIDASSEAVHVAQGLLDDDPQCVPAWQALLILYERRGHLALAARACGHLVSLKPDDGAMKKKLKELKARAGR